MCWEHFGVSVLFVARGAQHPAPAAAEQPPAFPCPACQYIPVHPSTSQCLVAARTTPACAYAYTCLVTLQLVGRWLQFSQCSSHLPSAMAWGIPNCKNHGFTDFPESQPAISITWAYSPVSLPPGCSALGDGSGHSPRCHIYTTACVGRLCWMG